MILASAHGMIQARTLVCPGFFWFVFAIVASDGAAQTRPQNNAVAAKAEADMKSVGHLS